MFINILISGVFIICFSQDVRGNTNCIDVPNNESPCTRGCQQGYHGSFCNETCSEHCGGACSQDTGHCLTGCKPNWFTSTCSQPCSGNCVDDVCDRRSAECIRGCKGDFYGLNCSETCSVNCIGGKCDINGGCKCEKDVRDEACYINCEDCVGGVCAVGDDGQLICPRGCKEEQIGSFCKELASCDARPECQSLKIRETENCHEEDEHGQCTCCKEGWRGPKCDIPCPPCRYNYRDGCSIACAGGFFGEECHLDCPADCSRATNGKSRCDETGVCDSGCLQGNYGYVCERKCPATCLARTCFMNNGSCTEGCVPGRWGTKCQYQCGHCVDLKCGRDGSCTCEDKYFGRRCQHICSDHCVSGLCSVDIDGNHVCEGECQPSYTGLDCLSRCPSACYNDHCGKESGTCKDFTDGDDDNTITIIIVVCVVIGIIIIHIIIAIIIICIIIRRKRKQNEQNEEPPEKDFNKNKLSMYKPKPDLVTDEKKQNIGYKNDDGLKDADLLFDDGPRSKRPLVLADDMTDYDDSTIPQV